MKTPTPKTAAPPTIAEQLAERKRLARALYVHGGKPKPEEEPKS